MYRLLCINRTTAKNIKLVLESSNNNKVVCGCNCRQILNINNGKLAQRIVPVLHYTAANVINHRVTNAVLSNKTQMTIASIGSSSGNTTQQRQQSTSTTNVETQISKKKVKKRKSKYSKYVEIMEVTGDTASMRKSRVRRLKAKKLQEFITKTKNEIFEKRAKEQKKLTETRKYTRKQQPIEYQKFNLDSIDNSILEVAANGLYDDKPILFFGNEEYTKHVFQNSEKINDILKSFKNFRDITETMEIEEHAHDYDAFGRITPEALEENPAAAMAPYVLPEETKPHTLKQKTLQETEQIISTISKPRYKSKIHNNEEQERLAKQRALRINLTTYLNVCVSAGMLSRGLYTVLAYRQRANASSVLNSNLITIDLYNILLHGYAENGTFERFNEIFKYIKEDGLQFNEQTFAATFECLGRVETSEENSNLIEKYINKAEKMGLTLDQIMDRAKFITDQRDIALDAIRRIQPDYTPTYTPPVLGYNNGLLNNLNDHVLPGDVPLEQCIADANNNSAEGAGGEVMFSKHGFTKEQLEQKAREQLKIELDGSLTIKSIEKSKGFANAEFCSTKLQELETHWRTQITTAVARDLNTLRAQVRYKPNNHMSYYTYLKTLDAEQYAEVLIQEIYKLADGSETFSPTVGQLYKELGLKVQQKYQIEQKKKNGTLEKIGEIYSSYCDLWENGKTNDNTRQIWQRIVHEQRHSGPSMDIREVNWPSSVLTGVGRFLYNILMRDIKIDAHIMRQQNAKKSKSTQHQNVLPAFYTLFRNQGRLVKEEVKPHPVLSRLFRASSQKLLTFDSQLVPMLCPPQPWSTTHNGGYLLNKSELIRLPHQAIQQWERINSTNPQNIYPALDSLNQLASVPWRVNTDILDVIIKVFQNGGDHKLDVPQAPSSLPPLPTLPDKDSNLSSDERAKRFKEKLQHRRKQGEMYSLWCDTLYRLSLADHYRDKVFWLPHNMDFRGRVYPVPPHLNHLGSDLARSMLVFDQPQPLGPDGFLWLKLHCINLTGLKKRDSVQKRLSYADQMIEEILDSADNPLTGGMWWAKSDEPWQTLACCMEIAKVHRSANPEEYLSHFPIHQDGSCNGLQHYAALGRDKAGAISVNLSPSSIPKDVYSAVAVLVEKGRKTDAENGMHVAQALEGYVGRKVIKQTVMTTVYGVTRYGARLQIAKQLKDIEHFPKEWVWPASTYLTTKTFESLREMFTSTREIQDWFTECARLISGICGKNVEWITPLGLPVVQPYTRYEYKHNTRNNHKVSETMSMDMYERPNVMKQKNAFPPNFIHSLDSSHMMLTSLNCERKGLTFVSVHDCFWTHACTVPDLNKICREQFVALHSQPILEDLSEFLKKMYSFSESDFQNDGSSDDYAKRQLNTALRKLPTKGDFDLTNVLNSIYFFS